MIGIILDHNGVVCDGTDFYGERSRRFAEIAGTEWSEALAAIWKQEYMKASTGEISREEFYASLSNKLDLKIPEDMDAQFGSKERMIPGIVEVIRELAKRDDIKLSLFSNYVEPWVTDFLNHNGLARYFDAVLVSSEVKVRKPDARAYELAAKAMEVPLSNCIYIGDAVADLKICKQLRIHPVFISGEESDPQGFEMINRVEDILKLSELNS